MIKLFWLINTQIYKVFYYKKIKLSTPDILNLSGVSNTNNKNPEFLRG